MLVLGWPEVCSGFSVIFYGKAQKLFGQPNTSEVQRGDPRNWSSDLRGGERSSISLRLLLPCDSLVIACKQATCSRSLEPTAAIGMHLFTRLTLSFLPPPAFHPISLCSPHWWNLRGEVGCGGQKRNMICQVPPLAPQIKV